MLFRVLLVAAFAVTLSGSWLAQSGPEYAAWIAASMAFLAALFVELVAPRGS